jgi:CheY-like chemotaxis protein
MTLPPSILVVDDNEANVALLDYLLTACGYEVRSALDAEDALVSIAQHRPALVLTDIQLPGASGLELTRRLKADPATAGIRVIAVSAFAMPADEERALAAGCDGYVAKPIDTRTLPSIVAEVIDRR